MSDKHTVISDVAAADLSGQEQLAVKMTSNGIDIAGATDRLIGTLIRGAAQGLAVDIFLAGFTGKHYATIGNNTAIAKGDELEQAAGGTFVKRVNGAFAGIACESCPVNGQGAQIRALLAHGEGANSLPAGGVTGGKIDPGFLEILEATGVNSTGGASNIALAAMTAAQRIVAVVDLTTPAAGTAALAPANFTPGAGVISQAVAAGDLSTKKLLFFVLPAAA